MKPTRIIWHHTANPTTARQWDITNQHHKMREFPRSSLGFYVGYHWFIERDGQLLQARLETEIGAHDQGENIDSIGIALAGDFTDSLPTEAQCATAGRLVGEIRKRWNIPITAIEPHRRDDSTECPGKMLPDNWLIVQYLKHEKRIPVKLFYKIGMKYKLL